MLPKTSRWTGESSCHWNTVAAMPDSRVTTAIRTPSARTTWCGEMRRGPRAAGVLSGLLTGPNLPNPAERGGILGGPGQGLLPDGHKRPPAHRRARFATDDVRLPVIRGDPTRNSPSIRSPEPDDRGGGSCETTSADGGGHRGSGRDGPRLPGRGPRRRGRCVAGDPRQHLGADRRHPRVLHAGG